MEMKEAIAKAKDLIVDLFADQTISDVALEEVEFEAASNTWKVTYGFNRASEANEFLKSIGGSMRRSYKLVRIASRTGKVMAVRDRELSD